jgi:hypothetical protein
MKSEPPALGKTKLVGKAERSEHDSRDLGLAVDDAGAITPEHNTATASRTDTRKILLPPTSLMISSF